MFSFIDLQNDMTSNGNEEVKQQHQNNIQKNGTPTKYGCSMIQGSSTTRRPMRNNNMPVKRHRSVESSEFRFKSERKFLFFLIFV